MRRPQELHWCGNIWTIWILFELFELLELWGRSGPISLILREKQEAEILATGDFQDTEESESWEQFFNKTLLMASSLLEAIRATNA